MFRLAPMLPMFDVRCANRPNSTIQQEILGVGRVTDLYFIIIIIIINKVLRLKRCESTGLTVNSRMKQRCLDVLFLIPILYRLFESYFYHVAANKLTSPNGGRQVSK